MSSYLINKKVKNFKFDATKLMRKYSHAQANGKVRPEVLVELMNEGYTLHSIAEALQLNYSTLYNF